MVFRLYWKQAGDRQNMIIRQLNIKNSGEIHDKTLEFSPGINVLYGENESERAIVHTYIKNMFLGDISEAIYDNAVFAAKLKSPTEQDLARELQKFMTGYQGTADSSMDLGRAMQMLKMSRKGYLVQADRKQKETEQERQKLLTRMDDIIMRKRSRYGCIPEMKMVRLFWMREWHRQRQKETALQWEC